MHTYIFMLLSAFGFLDSIYLTFNHYTRSPFSCPLFGGCDQVLNSQYSEIFGIPTALFGAVFYGIVMVATLYTYLSENTTPLRLAAQMTIVGLATSFVLVYIQLFVLGAICFYCMLSALTSTLLFVTGMHYLSKQNSFEIKTLFKRVIKKTSEQ